MGWPRNGIRQGSQGESTVGSIPACGSPATRSGLTILELLISVSVIAILAALILPVLGAVRESARRTACTSHLRQIGLALHCYADTHGCLPAGWQPDAAGSGARGWAVALLPLLEQHTLYQQIGTDASFQQASATHVVRQPLPLLLCPSDLVEPEFDLFLETDDGEDDLHPAALASGPSAADEVLTRLPSANYVGVFGNAEPDDAVPEAPGEGAFIEARPVRLAEFRRGLSNTLFIGERTMARLPSTWLGVDLRGEDAACRLVGNAALGPNCRDCDECEFASRHPGGANFLFGDGHVGLIADDIDSGVYRARARRLDF